MDFSLNIDNIEVGSIYTDSRPYDDKDYMYITVTLKSGENSISTIDMKKEDLSQEFCDLVRSFKKALTKELEIEVMRKAKQLPPHLDDSIEAAEGEVS